MLILENIRTSYGRIEAIKRVSLEIRSGEIVCLIGSNGSGKSTTLMTISGILSASGGKIYFHRKEIHTLSPHVIVSMGISQVPEGRRIFPKLTVRENLEMGAYLKKRGQKTEGRSIASQLHHVFDLFPVLGERQKQFGGTLSGGEQQMLAIGRALMSKPELLLLDEPSLGLAPIMVSRIFKTIRELNREGLTILLVEQNANAALKLAHRGYVIESGRITKEGKGADLLNDPDVKKSYLGE